MRTSSARAPPAATELAASKADGEQLLAAVLSADEKDGLITLPGGLKWPQLFSDKLFVRSFYSDFFEGVLKSGDPSEKYFERRFILTGTPGIGKSAFGLYCLWRALRSPEKRAVIYLCGKHPHAWVFQADGNVRPFDKNKLHLIDEVDGPSTLLISDSIVPPGVHAFTIYITTPKPERWHGYSKTPGTSQLFFPVFQETEIERMWETCFSEPPPGTPEKDKPMHTKEAALERFQVWGGIPRYVLTLLDKRYVDSLDTAVGDMNMDIMDKFLRTKQVLEDSVWHLKIEGEQPGCPFTAREAGYYDLHHTEVGSPYMRRGVYQALVKKGLQQLDMLLKKRNESTAISTFVGRAFEDYALVALAKERKFPVRLLQTDGQGKEDELPLPSATVRSFGSKLIADLGKCVEALRSEGKDPAHYMLKPGAGFPAIDVVLPGLLFANCTINAKHDIILGGGANGGLADIVKACNFPEDKPVDFYWLVPQEDFEGSNWRTPKQLSFADMTVSVSAAGEVILGKKVKRTSLPPSESAASESADKAGTSTGSEAASAAGEASAGAKDAAMALAPRVRQWALAMPFGADLMAQALGKQAAAGGAFQATKGVQQGLVLPRLPAWQPKRPAPSTATTSMLAMLRAAVRALKK